MNTRDLPGYGDEITWGPITSPNDPRCDDDSDDLGVMIETIFQNYMSNPQWVRDARREISDDEDDLINAALMAGNALVIGEVKIEATQRVIRRWAEKEARKQLGIEQKAAEDEHYASQVAA